MVLGQRRHHRAVRRRHLRGSPDHPRLSERRKAEDELRATRSAPDARQRLPRLRDLPPRPEGHVVTWNIGAEGSRATGDEIVGKHFSPLHPRGLIAGRPREIEVASREGRYEEEGWRVRKDGSKLWAASSSRIARRAGRLRGFSKARATYRAARERADQVDRRQRRRRHRHLDENGTIESLNPAAERVFGYEPPRSSAPRSPGSPQRATARLDRHTRVRRHPRGVRPAQGRRRLPNDLAIGPFHFQGRRAYTAVVRDITERHGRGAAALLRPGVARPNAELARSIRSSTTSRIDSHDLKEPLRGIHNYANFLLEDYADKLDAEAAQARDADPAARRMEALIARCYSSRGSGASSCPISRPTSTSSCAWCSSRCRSRCARGDRHSHPAQAADGPLRSGARARGVPHLVINAIKYNDKPHKWVEIGWQDGRAARPDPRRDNGIGMQQKLRRDLSHVQAPARPRQVRRRHRRRPDDRQEISSATAAGSRRVLVGEGTTFPFRSRRRPHEPRTPAGDLARRDSPRIEATVRALRRAGLATDRALRGRRRGARLSPPRGRYSDPASSRAPQSCCSTSTCPAPMAARCSPRSRPTRPAPDPGRDPDHLDRREGRRALLQRGATVISRSRRPRRLHARDSSGSRSSGRIVSSPAQVSMSDPRKAADRRRQPGGPHGVSPHARSGPGPLRVRRGRAREEGSPDCRDRAPTA